MQENPNHISLINIKIDSFNPQNSQSDYILYNQNTLIQRLKGKDEQQKPKGQKIPNKINKDQKSLKSKRQKTQVKSMDFSASKTQLKSPLQTERNKDVQTQEIIKNSGRKLKKKTSSQTNSTYNIANKKKQNKNTQSKTNLRPKSTEPKVNIKNIINSNLSNQKNSETKQKQIINSNQKQLELYEKLFQLKSSTIKPSNNHVAQKEIQEKNLKEQKLVELAFTPDKNLGSQTNREKDKKEVPKLKLQNVNQQSEYDSQISTRSQATEIISSLSEKRQQNTITLRLLKSIQNQFTQKINNKKSQSNNTQKLPQSSRFPSKELSKIQANALSKEMKDTLKKCSNEILKNSQQINKYQRDKLKNINQKFIPSQQNQKQIQQINSAEEDKQKQEQELEQEQEQEQEFQKPQKFQSDKLLFQKIIKQCKFQQSKEQNKSARQQKIESQKLQNEVNFYKRLLFYGKKPFINIIEYTDQLLFPFTNIKIKYIITKYQDLSMTTPPLLQIPEKKQDFDGNFSLVTTFESKKEHKSNVLQNFWIIKKMAKFQTFKEIKIQLEFMVLHSNLFQNQSYKTTLCRTPQYSNSTNQSRMTEESRYKQEIYSTTEASLKESLIFQESFLKFNQSIISPRHNEISFFNNASQQINLNQVQIKNKNLKELFGKHLQKAVQGGNVFIVDKENQAIILRLLEIGGRPFVIFIEFLGKKNFFNVQIIIQKYNLLKCNLKYFQSFSINIIQNFIPSDKSLELFQEAQREIQKLDHQQVIKFQTNDILVLKTVMLLLGYDTSDNDKTLIYKTCYTLSLTYLDYPNSQNSSPQINESFIETRKFKINKQNYQIVYKVLIILFQQRLYRSDFPVIQKMIPILIELARFIRIIPAAQNKFTKQQFEQIRIHSSLC